MDDLCGWFGISRQAHYAQRQRDAWRQQEAEQVLAWVRDLRQRHPRMGGRKLLHSLQPQLEAADISLGRDRFFDLLAQHDLLLAQPRQARRTTWSGFWRCPNLLVDALLTQPGQAWVCDITYLETRDGFCYLALVTDAFSRCVLGFDVSASLAVEGALRALDMALEHNTWPLDALIHHSDHGVQYTCQRYRERLLACGIRSSMGEVGNCYDNAIAERINGILKLEYGLDQCLIDLKHAQFSTQQAVWLYNHERPHWALQLQTPACVHFQHRALP